VDLSQMPAVGFGGSKLLQGVDIPYDPCVFLNQTIISAMAHMLDFSGEFSKLKCADPPRGTLEGMGGSDASGHIAAGGHHFEVDLGLAFEQAEYFGFKSLIALGLGAKMNQINRACVTGYSLGLMNVLLKCHCHDLAPANDGRMIARPGK
jgi:hypothetical protein